MRMEFSNLHSESETRYDRQQRVAGWQQSVLAQARLLVVGAGALGNELLKNLALSGVGSVDVADFDVIEISNLSRCVLFREGDLGRNKAVVAAERLRAMNPQMVCDAMEVDVQHGLGAGALRGYDLVLGAVDSIDARLAINRLCRTVGVPWMDGGMDARGGQVCFFDSKAGACYECGMTEQMWERVAERQSCLRMGTGVAAEPMKMAATVTMAATIGAVQAQEAIRWLLRECDGGVAPMQLGERVCVQTAPHAVAVLQSPVRKDCPWHEASSRIEGFAADADTAVVSELLRHFNATRLLLQWDVVSKLECAECSSETYIAPLFALTADAMRCPKCGRVRVPEMQSSIAAGDTLAAATLQQVGVPPQAVLELCIAEATDTQDAQTLWVEIGRAPVAHEVAEEAHA